MLSLKNAAGLFAALTCLAPAAHAAPPQIAPPKPADTSVGSEPERLPRNWLAFTYDYRVSGIYTLEEVLPDLQRLVVVLRDGTVIWNDAVFNYDAYYPKGAGNKEQSPQAINPEAWRQGKADPAKLQTLVALLKKSAFVTDKPPSVLIVVTHASTQRVGVKLDGRVRIVDQDALEHLGSNPKDDDVGDTMRRLYAIYKAIEELRPATSTRYIPHTIRVSVWKVKPREKLIPDAEDEAEAKEPPVFADWPQSGLSSLPTPARMSETIKDKEMPGWEISHDDRLRNPSTYTYLTGSKARALMDLVAQNSTFRYKDVLYRIKWSPALRAPEPTE